MEQFFQEWNKIFKKMFQGPKFALKISVPPDQIFPEQNSSDRVKPGDWRYNMLCVYM